MVKTIYVVDLYDEMTDEKHFTAFREDYDDAVKLAKEIRSKLKKDGFSVFDHSKHNYLGDWDETWLLDKDFDCMEVMLWNGASLQDYNPKLWKHAEPKKTDDDVILFAPTENKVFDNESAAWEWMKEQETNSTFKL